MKLTKLLLPFLSISLLSGCDAFGNKEDDTTVYHTVLAFQGLPEDLITSNNYKIQAVSYSEDSDGELVADPITYNEVNATYQSRVDLKAPFVPGYKFLGWFDDSNVMQGGLGDTNIKDGYDFFWNQYQKNGTFYAKYELWNYEVVYGNFLKEGQNAGPNKLENGYIYNINKGEVEIPDGATTNDHETFKEWYYIDPITRERVVASKLPNDYFESILVLFGEFETEKFQITANYDNTKGSVECIDAIFTDGSLNPHIDIVSSNQWKVEYGYSDYYVSFKLTPAEGYIGATVTVDNVFAGNSYLEQGQESFDFGFQFNHGKDIVVEFDFFGRE